MVPNRSRQWIRVCAVVAVVTMPNVSRAVPPDFASRDAAWAAGFTLPLPGTGVRAIGRRAGQVLIGGDFSVAGEAIAPHLAAWDGASWRTLGEGPGAPVRAITSLAIESSPFSRFLLLTNTHSSAAGSAIWFNDSTRLDGRVHTNTRLKFAWRPQFGDTVSSTSSTAEYYNNGVGVQVLNADSNGTVDVPDFQRGFSRGYRALPLPVNGFAQEWAVLGLDPHPSRPSNATVRVALGLDSSDVIPPNGIHLVTQGGSVVGGIRVQGWVDQLRCTADTLHDMLELRIVQGSTAVVIKVDPDSQLTTYKVGAADAQRFQGVPNGLFVVIGGISDVRGPDRVSGIAPPAFPRHSKWNIVTTADVMIQRDITLHDAASATNVLGICSTTGSVWVGMSAPNDCRLDAFVMALGNAGEFKVENYNVGAPRGTFQLRGGVVARYYGPFFTFDHTGVHRTGYTRDFRHDARGLVPPHFPRVLGVSPERTVVACDRVPAASGLAPTIRLWNGTSWSTIGSTDGDVNSLIEWQGQLIAAGDFSTVDGVPARGIASWDGSSWSAMGEGFPSQHVSSLEVLGDELHAGGELPGVGHVARWDGVKWAAIGPALPGPVLSMRAGIDGLYVCAHSESASTVRRWTGTEWFDTGATGEVEVLGDRIARVLATFGDPPTLQGFNGEQWSPLTNSLVMDATAFHAIGDTAHVAGQGELEGAPVTLLAFDGAVWKSVQSAWNAGMTGVLGSIDDAAEWGGSLVVAGEWAALGAGDHWSPGGSIARWTGSAWEALGDQVPATRVASAGSDLLVAGECGVRRWTGSGWSVLGDTLTGVQAIGIHSGLPLAVFGGDTATASPPSLMHWSGTQWEPAGVALGATDRARTLISSSEGQYLVGEISSANGSAASGIVRWDGIAVQTFGGGPGGEVHTVDVSQGRLLAGGLFTDLGTGETHGAVRWDGDTWSRMGSSALRIDDFATLDGRLYALGRFAIDGGVAIEALAAWDGTDWYPLGSGFDRAPKRLVIVGGDLFVAGDFSRANGRAARGVARLPLSSTLGASHGSDAGAPLLLSVVGPQPSRGQVRIALGLPTRGDVRLSLFDVQGRRQQVIEQSEFAAGLHELVWDPNANAIAPLRAGIYFLTLEHGGGSARTRLVLLR